MLLVTIAFIVGYGYSVMYVGGMGSSLSDMYKESEELRIQEEGLNSIKRVAENADQRNGEISKYIIPVENEGSIRFMKLIEDTAERSGVKYNTNSIEIVPDGALSKINKEYLSINMSLSGSEMSVTNFIKSIESLPFNAKIKSFSLTKIGGLQTSSTKSVIINEQLDCVILIIKEK